MTDVNVTIRDLVYTEQGPPDIDLMVVAPNGATGVMLMSDACGDNDNRNPITNPITLTFDDEAAGPPPADGACSSGTFQPVDDDNDGETIPFAVEDTFPPGQASPPPPPTPASASLSTFDGLDPNGDWKLYMIDDAPDTPDGEAGRIGGGWTISLTTGTSVTTTTTGGGGTTTSTTAGGGTTTTTAAGVTTTTTGAGGPTPTFTPPAQATTTTTRAGTTVTTVTATTATTQASSATGTGTPSQTATGGAGAVLRLSTAQVAPGDRVTVAGEGLPANSPLSLTFLSTPVSLGTVTTGAAGTFQTTVTVPASADPGPHQITVSDSRGRVMASVGLTVVRPGTPTATARPTTNLAFTGSHRVPLALLGALLVLSGSLMVLSERRVATRRPR